MANVRLDPEDITETGLSAATYTAMSTADTYLVANNGKVILHFKKTGAGNANVSIVTPGTVAGLAIAERVVVIPATTGDVFIGKLSPGVYNVSGDINFTMDDDVGLTCAVLRT